MVEEDEVMALRGVLSLSVDCGSTTIEVLLECVLGLSNILTHPARDEIYGIKRVTRYGIFSPVGGIRRVSTESI